VHKTSGGIGGLPLKILVVFGTRPECIKLAPIIKRAPSFGVEVNTCVTGQHREMLAQCLELFGITPDVDLSVMRPNQSLSELTGRILHGIAPVLDASRPDCVMVQGDTTTAFAAALAAFYKQIPVAHVEAGLRTYDLASPFPEEGMRQMITRVASWNFAPTEKNRLGLLAENVSPERVFVTGNTVIDALFFIRDLIVRKSRHELLELPTDLASLLSCSDRKLVLITGHRRESFGTGIQEICCAIAALAEASPDVIFIYPVHLNPNVLGPVQRKLSDIKNVHLLKPLDYYTFVYLMNRAYIIISDSGGIQEEAPSLKVPVLVTRNVTERMEVVATGSVKLVGSNSARIIAEAHTLLTDPQAHQQMTLADNPFGDGRAADRILQLITARKAIDS